MEHNIQDYNDYLETKCGAQLSNMIINWVRENGRELIEFERKSLDTIVQIEFRVNDSKKNNLIKQFKQLFPFVKQPKIAIEHAVYIIAHS